MYTKISKRVTPQAKDRTDLVITLQVFKTLHWCHHHLETPQEPLIGTSAFYYEVDHCTTFDLLNLCLMKSTPIRRCCLWNLPMPSRKLIPFLRCVFFFPSLSRELTPSSSRSKTFPTHSISADSCLHNTL